MKHGDVLEVETGPQLAQGGEAVARGPDGRVLFVRGGAPSERIRARVVEVGARFARAERVEVLQASPVRVEPDCPHSDRCGGCGLMHLHEKEGRQLKLQAGLQVLQRVGRLSPDILEGAKLVGFAPFGTRSRARFLFDQGRVGFREARSHRVADIESCRALAPPLEAVRSALSQAGLSGTGEIEAVTNGSEVRLHRPDLGAGPRADASAVPRGGFGPSAVNSALPFEWAQMEVSEAAALERPDPAGLLRMRPDVFAQASSEGNDALLRWLEPRLGPGRLALELHAGSGNFTRLLAARYERVVAVETHPEAVGLGRSLGLSNVAWRQERATEAYVGLDPKELDLVWVDPPRTGLDRGLRAKLRERPPARMIYVSCDVGTLARDLQALMSAGLIVEQVAAFDLYPRTPHLEWVVEMATSRDSG